MVKIVRLLTAVVFAASIGACGSVDSPSNQTSETYSDTLAPLGQMSKNFSVSKTGEMSATLQSLTPRPVVGFVQLAVGTPSGSTCAAMFGYVVSQAAIGQQYSFGQITKGSYCLLVADGNAALTTNTAFSVTFNHP